MEKIHEIRYRCQNIKDTCERVGEINKDTFKNLERSANIRLLAQADLLLHEMRRLG